MKYALKEMGCELQVSETGSIGRLSSKATTKPIRLKNLGEEYTNEAIKRRLIENQRMKIEPFSEGNLSTETVPTANERNKLRKKGGLYGLYLYYCYRLGYLPKYKKQNTARLHYLLKEDLLKLDRISMEARLLGRENISTDKELFSYKASIENQIETLTDERTHLRKTLRRNLSDDELSKVKGQISTITDRIRTLRKGGHALRWDCREVKGHRTQPRTSPRR